MYLCPERSNTSILTFSVNVCNLTTHRRSPTVFRVTRCSPAALTRADVRTCRVSLPRGPVPGVRMCVLFNNSCHAHFLVAAFSPNSGNNITGYLLLSGPKPTPTPKNLYPSHLLFLLMLIIPQMHFICWNKKKSQWTLNGHVIGQSWRLINLCKLHHELKILMIDKKI